MQSISPCSLHTNYWAGGTIGIFEAAFSLLSSLQTVHISRSLLELLNGRRGNCHPKKGNPSLSVHWDNQGISNHVLRRRCSPDSRKSRNIAWNRLSFKTVQLLTSFDPLFLLLLHPELKMQCYCLCPPGQTLITLILITICLLCYPSFKELLPHHSQ